MPQRYGKIAYASRDSPNTWFPSHEEQFVAGEHAQLSARPCSVRLQVQYTQFTRSVKLLIISTHTLFQKGVSTTLKSSRLQLLRVVGCNS